MQTLEVFNPVSEETDNESPPQTLKPLRRPDNSSAAEENRPKDLPRGRTMYCHYFSNYGKCHYEERTKRKCKYEHAKKVPVCLKGTSCSRPKCMYSHLNLDGRNSTFLGKKKTVSQPVFLDQQTLNPWQKTASPPVVMNQQTLNPWQIMAPWWLTPPGQMDLQSQWQLNQQQNFRRQ